jgi:hypothetical protein
MLKLVVRTFLLIAVMATATPVLAERGQSGYAKVNGTETYYEVSGKGAPLVMLLAKMYPGVDWPTLMRKTGELDKQDFDWSAGHYNLIASSDVTQYATAFLRH